MSFRPGDWAFIWIRIKRIRNTNIYQYLYNMLYNNHIRHAPKPEVKRCHENIKVYKQVSIGPLGVSNSPQTGYTLYLKFELQDEPRSRAQQQWLDRLVDGW